MTPKELRDQYRGTQPSDGIYPGSGYMEWLESLLIEKEKECERLNGKWDEAGDRCPQCGTGNPKLAPLRSELETANRTLDAHDAEWKKQTDALRAENEGLRKDRIGVKLIMENAVLKRQIAEADEAIVNGVVGPDGLCAFCDEQEKNPLVVEVPHKSTCIVLKSQSRQKARGK